jgi:uncharacterized protein with GYD domain
MAKYTILFSYTSNTWARMISSPGDRTAAVRRVLDSVGGSLECVYWMLGTNDGIVIFDVPDSVSAAAVSVAVTSTGAFEHVETHELLTQEHLGAVLQQARDATHAYQPPGQPS